MWAANTVVVVSMHQWEFLIDESKFEEYQLTNPEVGKMRYLFVFLFQICTLVSFAQTAVSGVVSDKKGVPLAYANVIVYRSADTTYIDGAVTDDAGRFKVSVPTTPCLLRVSCLGYNDCWSSALSDNMHIQLDSAAYMMDEAVVSARRPTFSMTGEGIVTNVAGTLLGTMGTAETVLSRIPSVVEKDGAWEVFGKGTPIIYLNGHVLQDMNELKNIKASDVKNVEVVTAPGAKYSASVRAVIKIKTIRPQGEGLSLDTYTNYRYNRFGNFAQSVVGNYRHGKLDAFATYEYSTSRGYSDQRFEQTVAADTLWRINTDNYYSGRTAWHYLQGGLYYDFTSDQSVGVKYSTTISGNEYMKGWLRSDALADGDPYDHTSTGMRQHNSDRPSQYLNVYYAGKIGATSVEFDNDYYFEHSIYDTYNKEVSETHDSREVDTRNSSRSSMAAWKLDMETPILGGALSYGAEYINTHRKDAYSSNMKNVVDDASSKIEESSLCPYLEYGWSGKIGNLKGGLRYEFVKFKYYENNVYMPGQSKDYHNFFPSLSYEKSLDNLSLQVGYSAKTTRPNYTQLSNNISYANRFLRQSGNPLLRHQTDHTVSLSAVWKFVQMALEYKDVRNAIIYWTEQLPEDESVTMVRYKNQKSIKSMTAFISVAPTVGWWSPQYSAGMVKQWLNLSTGNEVVRLNKPVFVVTCNNSFKLPWGMTGELDYSFSSKGNQQNYYAGHTSNVLTVGLRKPFLHDNLAVEVFGNDLLHQNWDNAVLYSHGNTLSQVKRTASRSLSVTLRYTFNGTNVKYKGSGAGQNEINRF